MSKTFVVVSGLISIAIGALYLMTGNEGVLGVIFTIYAIFSGGIVGIFLLGPSMPFSPEVSWAFFSWDYSAQGPTGRG